MTTAERCRCGNTAAWGFQPGCRCAECAPKRRAREIQEAAEQAERNKA